MLIVDLVLAVCMAGNSQACHDEHLYFESHGSLKQCMFEAQPAIAEWAGNHPKWRVSNYHCEWAHAAEQKT